MQIELIILGIGLIVVLLTHQKFSKSRKRNEKKVEPIPERVFSTLERKEKSINIKRFLDREFLDKFIAELQYIHDSILEDLFYSVFETVELIKKQKQQQKIDLLSTMGNELLEEIKLVQKELSISK